MASDIPERARRLLQSRYLKQAQRSDAEEHVNRDLDSKIEHLHGQSEVMQRLRALSGQASELWRNRRGLSGKHLLYLTAGLLYFISPVDAVTDVIPVLGYVDDVAVLAWILSQIRPTASKLVAGAERMRDDTLDRATDQLVDKGRVALNEVVDQRTDELIERLDDAAEDVVRKYVTAVVIGLWGTSTAAALSLALSLMTGGYTREWLIYIGVTTLLVLGWNLSVGVLFLRRFRQMDERWQQALPKIVGAKVGRWQHVLAMALPLLALLGLALAHVVLH